MDESNTQNHQIMTAADISKLEANNTQMYINYQETSWRRHPKNRGDNKHEKNESRC